MDAVHDIRPWHQPRQHHANGETDRVITRPRSRARTVQRESRSRPCSPEPLGEHFDEIENENQPQEDWPAGVTRQDVTAQLGKFVGEGCALTRLLKTAGQEWWVSPETRERKKAIKNGLVQVREKLAVHSTHILEEVGVDLNAIDDKIRAFMDSPAGEAMQISRFILGQATSAFGRFGNRSDMPDDDFDMALFDVEGLEGIYGLDLFDDDKGDSNEEQLTEDEDCQGADNFSDEGDDDILFRQFGGESGALFPDHSEEWRDV